ncbi:MAG: hypothetical protein RJA70_3317 [Pseudomonadota bacterium]|jgi:hypothetical protein
MNKNTINQTHDEVGALVREQYGNVAYSTTGTGGCVPGSCGPGANARLRFDQYGFVELRG